MVHPHPRASELGVLCQTRLRLSCDDASQRTQLTAQVQQFGHCCCSCARGCVGGFVHRLGCRQGSVQAVCWRQLRCHVVVLPRTGNILADVISVHLDMGVIGVQILAQSPPSERYLGAHAAWVLGGSCGLISCVFAAVWAVAACAPSREGQYSLCLSLFVVHVIHTVILQVAIYAAHLVVLAIANVFVSGYVVNVYGKRLISMLTTAAAAAKPQPRSSAARATTAPASKGNKATTKFAQMRKMCMLVALNNAAFLCVVAAWPWLRVRSTYVVTAIDLTCILFVIFVVRMFSFGRRAVADRSTASSRESSSSRSSREAASPATNSRRVHPAMVKVGP